MRVAMLSYHTCPLATLGGKDTGGMNVYVRDLTRYLGALGVQVDVFTRSQDEHVPHVLHDLGFGNRVVHIPAGAEVPLSKESLIGFIPAFVSGIEAFAQRKGIRYDLIHSHYWMSGMAALSLREAWNTPVIQMFHTLGKMKQRVARLPYEVEEQERLLGEQRLLKSVDCIVVSTSAEFAQLQWLYHADVSKVRIIPPGVDVTRFYPIPEDEAREFIGVKNETCMLLYVGRIEPLKGLDTLIKAIAMMRRAGVYVCLAIIGGDAAVPVEAQSQEMRRIQELCHQEGLDDLVTFLGKKSQDTLPYYYSAAQAVVVPSHYESFGMVALEAMACGAPVVASEVGGLAYLVQDGVTGFTVPADDPQALAERLMLILKDRDLRKRLGQQAVEAAQAYAWQNIAQKVFELYQSVLAHEKRGETSKVG